MAPVPCPASRCVRRRSTRSVSRRLSSAVADTLYAATAGGMGPATVAALQRLLSGLAADPAGILIAATDADIAGRRYAARLEGLAAEAGVRFSAILPPDGLNDWNDFLVRPEVVKICADR